MQEKSLIHNRETPIRRPLKAMRGFARHSESGNCVDSLSATSALFG